MTPMKKMEQLQDRVDKTNKKVLEKRKQLLSPTPKQLDTQIRFSSCGGGLLFVTGCFIHIVYHTRSAAISLYITGSLMLLNAGILKIKKSKS